MNNRLLAVLICLAVQTTHALPAYEAGEVIFHPHSLNTIAMVAMQMLLGVSTFLYAYGMVRARHNHRKRLDALCGWAVSYLGVSTLVEIFVSRYGSPLSDNMTACVAHVASFIDGAVALYLWERTRPNRLRSAGHNPPVGVSGVSRQPTLEPKRTTRPLPPRRKNPVDVFIGKQKRRRR